MSKTIDRALEKINQSIFKFKEDSNMDFTVENAVMIWPNFKGEPNRFGNTQKNFNLVLNQEFADELTRRGWNVKCVFGKDDNGNEDPNAKLLFINVKVNMDSKYPPVITLYKLIGGQRTRATLDEESVGQVDAISIQNMDCKIHGYKNPSIKDAKTTAYLKDLRIVEEPDDYSAKWDTWMQSEVSDEHDYHIDDYEG